jgi:hypothetical protein
MNTEDNQFYQQNGQCDSNAGTCGPDGQTLNDQQKTGAGMNQAKETQEQINKYVNSLITTAFAPYVKVSDMDLGNQMQVFMAASQGIQDKQLVSAADIAYKTINNKLTASMKIHMNHAETSFANKQCYYRGEDKECLGDLKFINPSLYLKSLDGSHSDIGRMITPADKTLAYKFFMIRAVIGDMARTLEPDWVVTFKEGSSAGYKGNDVLDTFEYIDKNQNRIFGHNGVKINKDAAKILKADKVEVDMIVHNVFDEFISDCNQLKATTKLHHQVTVCQNINEITDPDYFLDLLTCLEIFNLATTAGFCRELVYEEEFEF